MPDTLNNTSATPVLNFPTFMGCKLVGMDIVEVSPPYDHAEITSFAAATLGLEFLYVLAANRRTENSSEITTLIERS